MADVLCFMWQPLVPQGTGPDITARLGVVPHHLQPKDPRVSSTCLDAVVAFILQIFVHITPKVWTATLG